MRPDKGGRRGIWADPAVMERVKELHQEGFSATQIARVLGPDVTRNAVIGQLHRSGITEKSRSIHPSRATDNASGRVRRKPRDGRVVAPLVHAPVEIVVAPLVHAPVEIAGTPLRVPMLKLDHGHCRYPLWDLSGAADGFLHCGLPKYGALSYCEAHARKCYQPDPKRRERNEREAGAA